ncbi:stage II sporulation protein P, partial [Bacillus cereus group sp. BceL175]
MNRGFFFMKFTNMRKLVLFVITTVLATFFLISLMVTSMKETKSTYLYNWL